MPGHCHLSFSWGGHSDDCHGLRASGPGAADGRWHKAGQEVGEGVGALADGAGSVTQSLAEAGCCDLVSNHRTLWTKWQSQVYSQKTEEVLARAAVPTVPAPVAATSGG